MTAAAAAALMPTVAAMAASQQPGVCPAACAAWSTPRAARPGWSIQCSVHLGGSAQLARGRAWLMRPSGGAGRGQAERERRPGAQHREAGPRGQRVVAVAGRVGGGDLRVRREACWMANAAAGVTRSSQSAAPTGSTEAIAEDVRAGRSTTMTAVTAAALRRSTVPRPGPGRRRPRAAPRCRRSPAASVSAAHREHVAAVARAARRAADSDRDRRRRPARRRR